MTPTYNPLKDMLTNVEVVPGHSGWFMRYSFRSAFYQRDFTVVQSFGADEKAQADEAAQLVWTAEERMESAVRNVHDCQDQVDMLVAQRELLDNLLEMARMELHEACDEAAKVKVAQ